VVSCGGGGSREAGAIVTEVHVVRDKHIPAFCW
jgi:hypothetical protein